MLKRRKLSERGFVGVSLCVFILLFLAQMVACQTISGSATNVIDGDTFEITTAGNQVFKIRLAGIDAPELAQDEGEHCQSVLSDKLQDNLLFVRITSKDIYGRYLGYAWIAGTPDINLWMIQQGCSWSYVTESSKRKLYKFAQSQAKAAHVGLWKNVDAIAPSEFRKIARCSNP
jgi:endonuclease YncB( thermonuclease family)